MKTRTVILIENTSGCEENNPENHQRKMDKYVDLVDSIVNAGWRCHFFAIEVGARGYNSTHVPYCLKSLGFSPKAVKKLLTDLSRAALVASYHIWLARNDREWTPDVIHWKPFPNQAAPTTTSASAPVVTRSHSQSNHTLSSSNTETSSLLFDEEYFFFLLLTLLFSTEFVSCVETIIGYSWKKVSEKHK